MADDELKIDAVHSYSTGVKGRTLNSARDQHFISDSSHGPAEAPGPVELFLGGIASCGVQQAEIIAGELGVPLSRAEVRIEAARKVANTADLHSVTLRFDLAGPDREQAGRIVEGYQAR